MAKKSTRPPFNRPYPDNIRFNVVETPTQAGQMFSGHYISSYCRVAPVTCFREQDSNRNQNAYLKIGGKYVTAKDGGGSDVTVDGVIAGPFQLLAIESPGPLRDGSSVYLRTSDNSHFLTSAVHGILVPPFVSRQIDATGTERNGSTTFTIYRLTGTGDIVSGDVVAFRSHDNGEYLTALLGGGGLLMYDATGINDWQRFQISFVQ